MDLDSLKKAEIIANTKKLIAEEKSIKYRDSLETVKLFLYGFVCAAALVAALSQVFSLIVKG